MSQHGKFRTLSQNVQLCAIFVKECFRMDISPSHLELATRHVYIFHLRVLLEI